MPFPPTLTHTRTFLFLPLPSSPLPSLVPPSLQGTSLTSAKKVLLLILHHIPNKCLFNVVVFGATHSELFPASQPKTKDTMTTAVTFVQVRQMEQGLSLMSPCHLMSPYHLCHLFNNTTLFPSPLLPSPVVATL